MAESLRRERIRDAQQRLREMLSEMDPQSLTQADVDRYDAVRAYVEYLEQAALPDLYSVKLDRPHVPPQPHPAFRRMTEAERVAQDAAALDAVPRCVACNHIVAGHRPDPGIGCVQGGCLCLEPGNLPPARRLRWVEPRPPNPGRSERR